MAKPCLDPDTLTDHITRAEWSNISPPSPRPQSRPRSHWHTLPRERGFLIVRGNNASPCLSFGPQFASPHSPHGLRATFSALACVAKVNNPSKPLTASDGAAAHPNAEIPHGADRFLRGPLLTMESIMKIEYRVRPITRFVVTRYHETDGGRTGGSETKGTYDNEQSAYDVAYALCKAEHDAAGTPPDDPNFQYPPAPGSFNTPVGGDQLQDLAGLGCLPKGFPA